MEAPASAAPQQATPAANTSPNAQLIARFYQAFANKDWETMSNCYHPEARFTDPVFPDLSRSQAVAMWRMFCENKTTNLQVTFSDVSANGEEGTANWEARYLYQGQPVHNKIQAKFTFREGKILRHTDQFDLWTWASQALGWTGYFLGWTGLVQNKIRSIAAARLRGFVENHPEYKSESAKL